MVHIKQLEFLTISPRLAQSMSFLCVQPCIVASMIQNNTMLKYVCLSVKSKQALGMVNKCKYSVLYAFILKGMPIREDTYPWPSVYEVG